jgi:hypothetical protein
MYRCIRKVHTMDIKESQTAECKGKGDEESATKNMGV